MLASPGCEADAIKLSFSEIPTNECDVDYYEPETEQPEGFVSIGEGGRISVVPP